MFDLAGACWGCPGVKVPLGEGWSLRPVGTKSFLGQAACCGGIPLPGFPRGPSVSPWARGVPGLVGANTKERNWR